MSDAGTTQADPTVDPAADPALDPGGDPAAGDRARERLAAVRAEVGKAVVGQDAAVSGLLVALLCGGHVLMEGVPGVAKTLLVRTLAGALSVDTRRMQFTPDLMPGDVIGTMVIDSNRGELRVPVERAPIHQPAAGRRDQPRPRPRPSRRCSRRCRRRATPCGRRRHRARCRPVHGRRNAEPHRVRGHLPAAGGAARPVPAEGGAAGARAGRGAGDPAAARNGFDPRDVAAAGVSPVAGPADVAAGQAAVGRVRVSPEVAGYIVDIARATRQSPSLSLGVSPRGATALLRAARAWAWLTGTGLRDPRRRQGAGARDPGPPARAATRGRARGRRRRAGPRQRPRVRAGAPMTPTGRR